MDSGGSLTRWVRRHLRHQASLRRIQRILQLVPALSRASKRLAAQERAKGEHHGQSRWLHILHGVINLAANCVSGMATAEEALGAYAAASGPFAEWTEVGLLGGGCVAGQWLPPGV
jgi:ferric-dicitrate binding protein FerR (iron transport regulator)